MNKPVFKSTAKKGAPAQYTRDVKAGETIFTEGDLGTEMFIIHEGKIEISKLVQGDLKPLVIFEKGDFFGEMAILEDLPRTATAKALTDGTLLTINGSTFDQMLRANPEIAVRMMRKLSRRLRETDVLLKEALGTSHPSEVPAQQADGTVVETPASERLVHGKSKMEFRLAKGPETTIGRRDPVTGINPDIDLTPVDMQRSISRRHAKIYRRDGKFFAAEEIGTMNGTFVNGVRLETGIPIEIKEGDEVRFGVVETLFHP
jgi:CRP-like cAMP-binding protein